jgi:hypothetical protein
MNQIHALKNVRWPAQTAERRVGLWVGALFGLDFFVTFWIKPKSKNLNYENVTKHGKLRTFIKLIFQQAFFGLQVLFGKIFYESSLINIKSLTINFSKYRL